MADSQEEAQFVEIVHGTGASMYLNLDCQLCHFCDQLAQVCGLPPDTRVDLATERGRLQLLPDVANSKERAATVLKTRLVHIPVLLMPLDDGDGFESETASVRHSRPSSTRSTSAKARKREEEDDVVAMNSGLYRFNPLLDSEEIASRFPQFDIHIPGKSASLKRTSSRRLSRLSSKSTKSK